MDDMTIELPPGWKVSSVPDAPDCDGRSIVYSLKVENARDTLHAVRLLNINLFMLDPKHYTQLRDFFQIVRTGDEAEIVLQPGASSASN